MLSNVTINRGQGGLGRISDNKDSYSAMLIVDSASSAGEYKLFTEQDSIDLGTISEKSLYQISEYFRFSQAPLSVKIIASSTDYSEALDLARFAEGEARQIGIYDSEGTFGTTDLSAIQTLADTLETEKIPASFFLAKPIAGTIEDLDDLGLGLNYRVSFIVGEDLTKREELADGYVGALGTYLGLASKTATGESLAWVEKSNVQSGSLFSKMGFVDGSDYTSKSQSMLNDLDNKKGLFFRRFVGLDGCYPNYDYSSIANTSDYSSFQHNKVFDKAFRNLNTAYTPKLNSKLKVIEGGKLDTATIVYFTNIGEQVLSQMSIAEEISGYIIEIPSDQNVLSTDTLNVVVKLRINGTARFIVTTLGFTL